MKIKLFILSAVFCSLFSFAQTFSAGGINYNVTSSTAPYTVEVGTNTSFSGALNIPETVSDGTKTYSVVSIGFYGFYGSGLTSVTIPNTVTTIGQGAFGSCTNLTSINIPTSVTTIKGYAFYNCGFTSVTIPNSVTTIGDSAFDLCTTLTSVVFSNSITSIGRYVFNRCSSLSSVTVSTATPLPIDSTVFFNLVLNSITLNVPAGSKAAYQAAGVWQNFSPIKEQGTLATVETNISNISIYPNPFTDVVKFSNSAEITSIKILDSTGKLIKILKPTSEINLSSLPSGFYFINLSLKGGAVKTIKAIKK